MGCSNFISFKSNVVLLEYDPKFKPLSKSTDDSTVNESSGRIPVSSSSSISSGSCPTTILITGSLDENLSYDSKLYPDLV